MPSYNNVSQARLATCHTDLQTIFNEVVKHFDNTIIDGQRGEEDQNQAFAEGKSKLKFPQSKHNSSPSMAVDAAPYPIDWNDTLRMSYFAGFVKGVAELLLLQGKISHKVRWGGDWDMDTETKDNTFNDLVHFELVEV
jgi:peptidoglycan L-alanyl-D-glutamate endopeptidase CwlK